MSAETDTFWRLRGRAVRAAKEARGAVGLSEEVPVDDILRRVESDGVGVAILDLGPGVAGAYLAPLGAPIVFVNGAEWPQRQRFTLAHEYGHHRLGHTRSVDAPPALSEQTTDPQEMQANVFAAEFLMARSAVKLWLARNEPAPVTLETVVRFAAAFGVSAHAACRRLRTVKAIDDERCSRLMGEIHAGEHGHLVEALGLAVPDDAISRTWEHLPRLPPGLRDSALGALLSGRATLEQLAFEVGRPPEQLRAMLEATGLDALVG